MTESTMPPSFQGGSAGFGPPSSPPPSSPPPSPPRGWPPPRRRRSVWRRLLLVVALLVFLASVVVNLCLFGILAGQFAEVDGLEKSVIRSGSDSQVVAVCQVTGLIDGEQADLIESFWRQVAGDDDVKAVVIRVNSPGGYVSACDRIHRRLKDLKDSGKTLIVSMGSVAASGGYYISAPAEAIYAEPTTMTGSIGVLGSWLVIKGTLEKYGAKAVIVRSTNTRAWKAAPNLFEEPADYHIEEVRKALDIVQERFEEIVRDGRGDRLQIATARNTYKDADGKEFTVEETVPFNGKVFIAEEARTLGLVDNVGYLDEAIEEAADLAGLSRPKVVRYAKRKGLMEQIGFGQTGPVVDLNILDEIQTPRLMMVWKVSP